uniref:NADH-ubiquinone oxidoreductase chain 6 n=1 Tax=Uromastyx benti TaxID=236742 RepID=D6RR70_9SAUR|nr:NADH dehydrogenase subunit 6 [Uromastyx benti]BAJ08058.1 NADH dehydrogenase subunit 6 [Uromastyx benti]
MYFVLLSFLGAFVGLVALACNPSPNFGAGALMVSSGFVCGVLLGFGQSFLALVLFLIYLGGMLVVFAYSVALSSDLYPSGWFNLGAGVSVLLYFVGVCVFYWFLGVDCGFDLLGFSVWPSLCVWDAYSVDVGLVGVVSLYSWGGAMLIIVVLGLLLTLFVVLDLVRGLFLGAVSG